MASLWPQPLQFHPLHQQPFMFPHQHIDGSQTPRGPHGTFQQAAYAQDAYAAFHHQIHQQHQFPPALYSQASQHPVPLPPPLRVAKRTRSQADSEECSSDTRFPSSVSSSSTHSGSNNSTEEDLPENVRERFKRIRVDGDGMEGYPVQFGDIDDASSSSLLGAAVARGMQARSVPRLAREDTPDPRYAHVNSQLARIREERERMRRVTNGVHNAQPLIAKMIDPEMEERAVDMAYAGVNSVLFSVAMERGRITDL